MSQLSITEVFEIENKGKLKESIALLEKILISHTKLRNSKELMFNLEAIKGRRVYKSLYYHYKVHLGLINGMISLNDFQGFREFFIEFENEKSSLSLYKKTLLDIFKAYEFNKK